MLTMRLDVVVRLALEPVDFRKSIDGLAIAVGPALGRDPMAGEVFLFRNRRRTAWKALYWTPNGYVLVYKRLERLGFSLPETPVADPRRHAVPGLRREPGRRRLHDRVQALRQRPLFAPRRARSFIALFSSSVNPSAVGAEAARPDRELIDS
jgi:hypothetical protein